MRSAFFLSVVLLGALNTPAQGGSALPATLGSGWQARLSSLLPAPGQAANVMQRRAGISRVDLQVRVAQAQGSTEVLNKVLSDMQSGIKPTYDPRLGFSRDEFARYLVFETTLANSGKTLRLPVTRDAGRVSFGDAEGLNGVLKGVYIDLKTGEMHGPEGYAARPVDVPPSTDADSGLKVVSGFQWKVIGSDAVSGNGVRGTLNLLQLVGGQIILSYKRTSMIRRVLNQGEIILGYTH